MTILPVLYVLYVAIALGLFAVALTNLWWMLDAWRTPESLAATRFGKVDEPRLSFSLIVPARHEESVLGHTLDGLAALNHPDFEVVVVIGHDDPGTAEVAEQAAARHPGIVRVVTDHNVPKNKPKALNTALPQCRGDIIGVFDAEDTVAPDLLRHVDARFRSEQAHIVQGGVQLMNYHSSWFSLRNVLEYFFWFRSRLHFHARVRFIPLGGNTVFMRRDLLTKAGGWDPECLAEDCEIGVRLSVKGAKVTVAYDPALVTREETPGSVGELMRQRTRWNQGFLQVFRKGDWKRLPTFGQRSLARFTLAMPFLQGFGGVLVPVAIFTALFVQLPVGLVLIACLPLLPILVTVAVEAVGLKEFCRLYGQRVRVRDYVRLVVGTPFYQLILAYAAARAATRELRGQRGWEKTIHVGAHRPVPTPALSERS